MRLCGESNIHSIYLMLGSTCNFKCRYCLQTCMNNQQDTHEPTEEVYQYIEHLIKIRPRFQDRLTLLFWGGEPLIYFDIIKKVINILDDKVDYAIVTNGSLITNKMVRYFNKHRVAVILSHDGPNTIFTRGKNVLDNPATCKTFKKIKNLSVESVTSQYNYDYASLFNYIESRLDKDVNVTVDRLQVTWDMPADIYNIPVANYNDKLRWLAGTALQDMVDCKDTNAVRLFQSYIKKLLKNEKTELPICGAFYNSLNIDCNGSIYVCHNSGERIGHISEERLVLKQRYDDWFDNHIDARCYSCKFFSLCGGSCPLEHGYRDRMCEVYKTFFNVCVDLANAYVNSFEPVDWGVADDKTL